MKVFEFLAIIGVLFLVSLQSHAHKTLSRRAKSYNQTLIGKNETATFENGTAIVSSNSKKGLELNSIRGNGTVENKI